MPDKIIEGNEDRLIMHLVIEGNEDEVPLSLKYFSNGYSIWDRIKAWFNRLFKRGDI